jgi:transposase-like protein
MSKCIDCGAEFVGSFSSSNKYCPACKLAHASAKSAEATQRQVSILQKSASDQERSRKHSLDIEKQRLREEQRSARELAAIERNAARHALFFDAVCPFCAASTSVSLASDGETKIKCSKCDNSFAVDYSGDVTALGPNNAPLRDNEDIDVKTARYCSECRFNLPSRSRKLRHVFFYLLILTLLQMLGFMVFDGGLARWGFLAFLIPLLAVDLFLLDGTVLCFPLLDDDIHLDVCRNKKVRQTSSKFSHLCNPNFRCKFWAVGKSFSWLDISMGLFIAILAASLFTTFKYSEPRGAVKWLFDGFETRAVFNTNQKSAKDKSATEIHADQSTDDRSSTSSLNIPHGNIEPREVGVLVSMSDDTSKSKPTPKAEKIGRNEGSEVNTKIDNRMLEVPTSKNATSADKVIGSNNLATLKLAEFQGSLAVVNSKIESERKRWQDANAAINALTNNKTRPVVRNSPEHLIMHESQVVIKQVEAGAPALKAEKARLEAMIQSLQESGSSMVP